MFIVEIDVHLCGDTVIVIHEADLRLDDGVIYRAHERPGLDKAHAPTPEMIEALTDEDLEQLEIITLTDWLQTARGLNSGMVIVELKGSSVDKVVKLAGLVYGVLDKSLVPWELLAVKSFCVEAMAKIAELLEQEDINDDRYTMGLLWASKPENIVMAMHKPAIDDVADLGDMPWWLKGLLQAKGMGMDFISVHYWTLIIPEFLAVARRLDLEVCAWVVNDVESARQLAALGVCVLTESRNVVEALQNK